MIRIFGVRDIFHAVMLAVGVIWCIHIIKRLPRDIAEVRDKYEKYKTRNDEFVLGQFKNEEDRSRYQQNCVSDFWTACLIQSLFFWPVTAIVLYFVLRFIIFQILIPISGIFSTL